MSVHWHGGPIWGDRETPTDWLIKALYRDGCSLVSFARPEQIKKIANIPCQIWLDNGAFSRWNKAKKAQQIVDWNDVWNQYYDFVASWYSRINHFLIPDVIEGSESENDELIKRVPAWLREKSVPVWHTDESMERLIRLADKFKTVAVGCCGPHRVIRTKAWENRMDEVFTELYINRKSKVKIHGLRMLDVRVLSKYPFASADSTNVAINVPLTEKRFPAIKDKLTRTAVMRAAIEQVFPPSISAWINIQSENKPKQNLIIPSIQSNQVHQPCGDIPQMTEHVMNPYCLALESLRAQPTHQLKQIGDQWRTPDSLWWGINSMFGPFVLDLFADESNAKCEAYYSAEDNALSQNWSERLAELNGAAYANPPYSRASQYDGQYITGMRQIIAHTLAMREAGGRYVFLIKAATGEVWWPEDADHIAFIRGRISFDLPAWYRPEEGQPSESSAGFGAAVAVFDKSWRGPKFDYISRDQLESRGATFMAQIERAAQRLTPRNIPVTIPESANDVWPAEVQLLADQLPDLKSLATEHQRKVMHHMNRMLLERQPSTEIIASAQSLTATFGEQTL